MPERMVTQLEADCESLAAAAAEHNPLVSERMTELWRSNIPKGQKVINILQLQSCLADDLIHRRDRLVDASHSALSDRTANRAQLQVRDNSVEELREKLFQARSTFEGVYGAGSSFKIFEEAPVIPNQPRPLRHLARRVVDNLTSPDFELPPVREDGVTLDPVQLAKGIEAPLRKMEEAMAVLESRRRAYDQSLQQKGSSMTVTRAMVGRIARFLEALYDLAGYEVLSDRVRPSSHRAARAAAEARAAEESAPAPTPATETEAEAEAETGIQAANDEVMEDLELPIAA